MESRLRALRFKGANHAESRERSQFRFKTLSNSLSFKLLDIHSSNYTLTESLFLYCVEGIQQGLAYFVDVHPMYRSRYVPFAV